MGNIILFSRARLSTSASSHFESDSEENSDGVNKHFSTGLCVSFPAETISDLEIPTDTDLHRGGHWNTDRTLGELYKYFVNRLTTVVLY